MVGSWKMKVIFMKGGVIFTCFLRNLKKESQNSQYNAYNFLNDPIKNIRKNEMIKNGILFHLPHKCRIAILD